MQDKKLYLSRIIKICAMLAVFALILAIAVKTGEQGENLDQNSGGEPAKSNIHDIQDSSAPLEDLSQADTEPISPELDTRPDASQSETTEPSETTEGANGPLNGRYRQTYKNGDVYVGDFVNGVRSGQGTYTWANGVVYVGEWADGEPTGNGEYTYPSTETPTAKPTETQTPKPPSASPTSLLPDMQNLGDLEGAVPYDADVPEPFGYFGDILFLGDSVTMGFDLFRNRIMFGNEAVLRDVSVIAVGSYSVNNALWDISNTSIHPLYGGKQTRPEDIIAKKSAKYVFICLGLNDVALGPVENYVSSYSLLIERIKQKSPDKIVAIMSVTPLVKSSQKTRLNNRAIAEANSALLEFAAKNGIPFIDYGAAIRDSEGNLYDELSSDAYCHLTISA
ncbi:MAG: GDSL-type esterase/lipase family protein, partial [Oscillospiraceae bacterium]|nr:GDSL-type esterase/lipase family protein [Oscillospiraceae bacterium]